MERSKNSYSLRTQVGLKQLQACWDKLIDELYEEYKTEDTQWENFIANNEAIQPIRDFVLSRLHLLKDTQIRDEFINRGNYVEQSKQKH